MSDTPTTLPAPAPAPGPAPSSPSPLVTIEQVIEHVKIAVVSDFKAVASKIGYNVAFAIAGAGGMFIFLKFF